MSRTDAATAVTTQRNTRSSLTSTPAKVSGKGTIHDTETARKVLREKGYVAHDTLANCATLALVVFQLSAVKQLPTEIVNALRAVGFLLEEIGRTEIETQAVEVYAGKIVEEMAEVFSKAAEGTMAGLRMEGEKILKQLQEATPIARSTGTQRTRIEEGEPPHASEDEARSYASMAGNPPRMPAAMATPIETSGKYILIDKAPGMTTNELAALNEKELVAKANLALEMMEVEGEQRPEGVEFVAVRKLRHGGALYEMKSTQGAEWLRGKREQKEFLVMMGGTSVIKEKMYQTIVEYVPVTFLPEEEGMERNKEDTNRAIRVVEQTSGLREGDIARFIFIKHHLRRRTGQMTAHAFVDFRNPNAANHAIQHGLFIEGKHVFARKYIQDPRRCYKCQKIGAAHVAAECRANETMCGRCGTISDHRTKECTAMNSDLFYCPNCNTRGHGAADRQCPKFMAAIKAVAERHPEQQSHLFPTSGLPIRRRDEDRDTHNRGQNESTAAIDGFQSGWTEVQPGRRGQGRLTGGAAGQGGGAPPANQVTMTLGPTRRDGVDRRGGMRRGTGPNESLHQTVLNFGSQGKETAGGTAEEDEEGQANEWQTGKGVSADHDDE